MKPTEALQEVIQAGALMQMTHHRGPGKIILAMPENGEVRCALRSLTSDQLAKVRVDPWELPAKKRGGFAGTR